MLIKIDDKTAGEINNNLTKAIIIDPNKIKFDSFELSSEGRSKYDIGNNIMFVYHDENKCDVFIREMLEVKPIENSNKILINFGMPQVHDQLEIFMDMMCDQHNLFYLNSLGDLNSRIACLWVMGRNNYDSIVFLYDGSNLIYDY